MPADRQLLRSHPANNATPAPPAVSGYAATKAYLDNLSRSLDAEYAPFGVRVQCIWAAFVATRMTPNLTCAGNGHLSGHSMSACVDSALRTRVPHRHRPRYI